MPYVDAYDTQSAIMLLTQIMSYGQVYDRSHLEEKKDIVDVRVRGCDGQGLSNLYSRG